MKEKRESNEGLGDMKSLFKEFKTLIVILIIFFIAAIAAIYIEEIFFPLELPTFKA